MQEQHYNSDHNTTGSTLQEGFVSQNRQSKQQNWRRPVALLLTGQALSLIGSSIVQYAIVWHLVMLTDSGVVMTLTVLCGALPQAIVSLFGGVWADRFNRKMLIMLPDGLIAIATVILSITIARGLDSLVMYFAILMIRSAGAGVQSPAVQAFIPDITPEGKLLRVNSINSTINSINFIVAPAIAAVVLSLMPLWAILYVDVTTAVIGILFVAIIRVRQTHAERTHNTESLPIFADMRIGLRYAWRFVRVRTVLLVNGLVCFITVAPMNLTLLLMNRDFQGEHLNLWFTVLDSAQDKLSANEIAWSLGMAISGAFLAAFGSRLFHDNFALAAIGVIGMGAATLGLGLAPTLLIYLIIDFSSGLATSFASTPITTMLQQEVEPSMQGRVFGLLGTFGTFGTPLGMLIFGPLADVIPVRVIFIIGGVLTIPVGLWQLRINAKYPAPKEIAHT